MSSNNAHAVGPNHSLREKLSKGVSVSVGLSDAGVCDLSVRFCPKRKVAVASLKLIMTNPGDAGVLNET